MGQCSWPKQKISAAIVTFNPDISLLRRVIGALRKQVVKLYVVDNCSDNKTEIRSICITEDADFIPLPKNEGIAAALNCAFKKADDDGMKWLLTSDQDSVMPDDLLKKFSKQGGDLIAQKNLGIICPNFVNRSTGEKEYEGESPKLIDMCITSGSLTRISSWKEIQGFDEEMFIDGVDFDFCVRLKNAGYKILLLPNVCIEHEIGNACEHSLFGYKFLVLNHSAFRKKYIAQNILYLDGKFNNGRITFRTILRLCKQFALVIFYEQDKKAKIEALWQGCVKGRFMCRSLRRS